MLKRNKIRDAFDLISISYQSLINENPSLYKFEKTAYISRETDKVITIEIFYKLIKLIDPKRKNSHIKLIFELIDWDKNNLLCKLYILASFLCLNFIN